MNPDTDLEYAWVNKDISSPSSVPTVGILSDRVYFIGARQRVHTRGTQLGLWRSRLSLRYRGPALQRAVLGNLDR